MSRLVTTHRGRTLDWAPRHDPASRAYGVRRLVTAEPTRPIWWTGGYVLDQGAEGSCAGHMIVAEYLASPARGRVASPLAGHKLAVDAYLRARSIDGIPDHLGEGTSVNAAMKVGRERGWWKSYHWAFGLADIRRALLLGPVCLGINWYDGLYATRGRDYEMVVDGPLVGGHAILITGWSPAYGRLGETFRLRNSWGPSFGRNGNGYMRAATLDRLLREDGEAAVPVQRAVDYALAA